MKKFVIIALSLLFASCGKETREISGNYSIPKGLSDCEFYSMKNDMNIITVVRCPNSSTSTTTSGKYSQTSVVIELEKDTIQEQIQKLENQLIELKKYQKE